MPSRSPSRRTVVASTAVVALLVAGGAFGVRAVVDHHDRAAAQAPSRVAVHTTRVVRTTLSSSVDTTGSVHFSASQTLHGAGTGVVTALPRLGAAAARGRTLYRVDDQPVSVFYGSTPMFRPIDHIGITGADVDVLAENLHQLGYFDGTIPDDPHLAVFSRLLRSDLKVWQSSIGATVTGSLLPGQVAVLPGMRRVTAVSAALGDPADEPIATVSRATRMITGHAPQGLLDGPATVTLPDGTAVAARVHVSSDGSPMFTAAPVHRDALDAVAQGGSVDVREITQIHRNVLAVPIVALLALRGGTQYALERPGGQLIAIRTGMFTDELVEVSGTGLTAGMSVVTAS